MPADFYRKQHETIGDSKLFQKDTPAHLSLKM